VKTRSEKGTGAILDQKGSKLQDLLGVGRRDGPSNTKGNVFLSPESGKEWTWASRSEKKIKRTVREARNDEKELS